MSPAASLRRSPVRWRARTADRRVAPSRAPEPSTGQHQTARALAEPLRELDGRRSRGARPRSPTRSQARRQLAGRRERRRRSEARGASSFSGASRVGREVSALRRLGRDAVEDVRARRGGGRGAPHPRGEGHLPHAQPRRLPAASMTMRCTTHLGRPRKLVLARQPRARGSEPQDVFAAWPRSEPRAACAPENERDAARQSLAYHPRSPRRPARDRQG